MSALPTVSCSLRYSGSFSNCGVGEATATGCRQTASQVIIRPSNVTITEGHIQFNGERRFWKPGHGGARWSKDHYCRVGRYATGGWDIINGSVKEET